MEAEDSSLWHSPARMGWRNSGDTPEPVKLLGASLGVGAIAQNASKGIIPGKESVGASPMCSMVG